jgi:hypothetical protein
MPTLGGSFSGRLPNSSLMLPHPIKPSATRGTPLRIFIAEPPPAVLPARWKHIRKMRAAHCAIRRDAAAGLRRFEIASSYQRITGLREPTALASGYRRAARLRGRPSRETVAETAHSAITMARVFRRRRQRPMATSIAANTPVNNPPEVVTPRPTEHPSDLAPRLSGVQAERAAEHT